MKIAFTTIILILITANCFCQSATYFYNKGRDLANIGEFTKAIKEFDKAIEADPIFSKAYNYRGLMKENTGDSRGAVADFSKTIELTPNFVAAYHSRGMSYLRLGMFDDACLDFTTAKNMGYKLSSSAYNQNCL